MKKNKSEKPSKFVSVLLFVVSKIYLFIFGYKVKYNRKVLEAHKDGFILINNHYTMSDQFLIGASVKARRINFVVSSHYFNNKKTKWALKLAKAIKKEQFISDISAIRKMKRVIDENGIVYLAPAGQVSLMGANNFIPKAIVKLVRLCKGSVVAMQERGAHLCIPKWSTGKRRRKIEIDFVDVINKDELSVLSDDEIYQRIVDSIEINDYLYQEENKLPIKGKEICKGLEGALFICPKCKKKHVNVTDHNMISCTSCGNTVIMDQYGFLNPRTKEDVCFKYPYEWYKYQKKLIKEEIKNKSVYVSNDVILRLYSEEKHTMVDAGLGKLVLTNNEFYYEGVEFGKNIHKDFDLEHIVQTPFSPHSHIEIPDKEKFYQFVPAGSNVKVISWVIVIEVMNDIRERLDDY